MLKKRVIPILLHYKSWLIKGKNFRNFRNIGNPTQAVKVFKSRNSDELIILDVYASENKKKFDFKILENISGECNMPLTVGGGLKNLYDIENVLNLGADKICINTSAIENPKIIKDISKKFGSQSIVVSIDVNFENNDYVIYSNQGSKREKINLIDWINKVQDYGVGEIIITSIHKEGTYKGYDLNLLKLIYDSIKVPLLFNGGAGQINDFIELFKYKKVMGTCASSVFFFSEITPHSIKKIAKKHKIPIRS